MHMAHMAAALRRATGKRIIVIVPDEYDARRMIQDLASFSDEDCVLLTPREFTFHTVETASHRVGSVQITGTG